MKYKNLVIAIPEEIIAQIKASPTDQLGGSEKELKAAWKNLFPLTTMSFRSGALDLNHLAWNTTPNPWWRFIIDMPLITKEEAMMLNEKRRPLVVPHLNESGWLVQERKVIDFRGTASGHMGDFPTFKLFQILIPVQKCDLLICCKEEIVGILKYMIVWKPDWMASRELLKKMGWSMMEDAAMRPNQVEVPCGNFVNMNILLWNFRGALNVDFKSRVLEMMINHQPSIMVITETRVGGDRAERIIAELPFDGFYTTDTIGYAGGLWLLWKKEEAEIFVLSSTEQEIHATVKVRSSNLTWIISPVYASPRLSERKILWANLTTVAQLHNLPWLVLRDFNAVLCGEDKYGGRPVNINRALEFKECLDLCNLLDLGFSGPKFIWSNLRQVTDLILERIDRCFGNPSWRIAFPKASVTHLPRVFTDHCPVLLELDKPPPMSSNRPFRFQTMWLMHLEFPRFVKDNWGQDQLMDEAITNFTSKVKKWNVDVLGNIFSRKKRVIARINGAQKALANHPNEFLVQLEKDLIEEYDLIRRQEEEFWALKSRLNWTMYGDKNTTFFHVTTMIRRQRNKIRSIMNSVGEWITDVEEVKNHILAGFSRLFTTELEFSTSMSNVSSFTHSHLSDEEKDKLCTEVTGEEIKTSLWSLKPFKAPGADGFHAGF